MDMELQNLMFAPLCFGLVMVQFFLPCPHAPLSEVFTLCHCALEVCNLF